VEAFTLLGSQSISSRESVSRQSSVCNNHIGLRAFYSLRLLIVDDLVLDCVQTRSVPSCTYFVLPELRLIDLASGSAERLFSGSSTLLP